MEINEARQYLDPIRSGEEDDEVSRSVKEHLERCADLRDEAAFIENLAVESPKLKITAPTGIEEEVMIRITDKYDVIDTDFGPAHVAFTPKGISAVKLDVEEDSAFESYYADRLGRPTVRGSLPESYAEAVRRAIKGEKNTQPPVTLEGLTEFEKTVLVHLARIPTGEVRPYAWLAREVGRPKAIRAVGTVMARNPVPFLMPCHRLVPSTGGVGNYYYGPEMKWTLLEREGIPREELANWKQRGVRFIGSRTTGIYCYPTCRDARRVQPQHRLEFSGAEEAVDGGYRPCKHCRPLSV
ncbi:MAG: methylated-DNA--[protein]-cysteine S-methyltransferase [Gemmatimonadetes bacterium]|nr:methylated-DNA--[protein]-cysteine S-methyltransferase [Gemmatimonadota bacterium]MYB60994.1 methylated-DNA--[protein]-cysteine S-methyltransferase [Gemmatimonadota bacterium]